MGHLQSARELSEGIVPVRVSSNCYTRRLPFKHRTNPGDSSLTRFRTIWAFVHEQDVDVLLQDKFQSPEIILFVATLRAGSIPDDASDAAYSKTAHIHGLAIEEVHVCWEARSRFLAIAKGIVIACHAGAFAA